MYVCTSYNKWYFVLHYMYNVHNSTKIDIFFVHAQHMFNVIYILYIYIYENITYMITVLILSYTKIKSPFLELYHFESQKHNRENKLIIIIIKGQSVCFLVFSYIIQFKEVKLYGIKI